MLVYGTGSLDNLRCFSRQCARGYCEFTLRIPLLSYFSLCGAADLPTAPAYVLQRPIPSGREPYASASHLRLTPLGGTGIFNPFAIDYAFRPRLRSRLTLFRLTLNRNPWAYGGQVTLLSYRYSFLHFLFQKLHHTSRYGFGVAGMLPYHST